MMQRWGRLNLATSLCSVLSLVTVVPASAQDIQAPAAPSGDAGYFPLSGGVVKGKRVKTQTAATIIPETATWYSLPLANHSITVPANSTDLFNVTFTAECRLINGVPPSDYLRIRVTDTVGGVTTVLEPYDGAQAFCSADGYATHTATYAKRAGQGVHTLQVQFWILDAGAAGALSAWIDDWTFEVVVYE
jgi:hypothetical protein